jgi:hypothetical protein
VIIWISKYGGISNTGFHFQGLPAEALAKEGLPAEALAKKGLPAEALAKAGGSWATYRWLPILLG